MPTTTFFHLPQEKRDIILSAARKEFARVGFNEVSINKIIQDAQIPRGSFYMYFKDKKDLLYCLLSEYATRIADRARQALFNSHGDIFAVFIDIYDFTVTYGAATENEMGMLKNIFSTMHANGMRPDEGIDMREILTLKSAIPSMEEIMGMLDLENTNIKSIGDLEDLMTILLPITKHSIAHALFHMPGPPRPGDSSGIRGHHHFHGPTPSRERFINMINLVKYGVIKRDPIVNKGEPTGK